MAEERKHLIGLSLSLCVRDIVEERVALGDVYLIVAGTRCTDRPAAILSVCDQYCRTHWSSFPGEARRVVRALLDSNRLFEPRRWGHGGPYIGRGHWLDMDRALRGRDLVPAEPSEVDPTLPITE